LKKAIGSPFNSIADLLLLKKFVKNLYITALFKVGFINKFNLVLRDGRSIKINKSHFLSFWLYIPILEAVLNSTPKIKNAEINNINKIIKFKFKNKVIEFYYNVQKQLYNTIGMIKEQFIEEQYKWLNVKGKDVIDIGANIGDSAIYFALKGAKHVYAFEPYPYSCDIANKNTRLNGLEDKIIIVNQGCGGGRKQL
jgi:hypothetical protein